MEGLPVNYDHKHIIVGQLYEQLWLGGQQAEEAKKALEAANARIAELTKPSKKAGAV